MNPQDLDLLMRIGAEMKRTALSSATPGELVSCSLDDGVSLVPLLKLLYGSAGEAETQRAMGIDAITVGDYLSILQASLRTLGMPERTLEELYARIPEPELLGLK